MNKIRTYSPVKFIIVSALTAILGKFIIGIIIGVFAAFSNITVDELLKSGLQDVSSPVYLFLFLCIGVPIIETIIFQWFPIALLQKLTSNIKLIIVIDSIVFASAHLYYSFVYTLIILPLAFVLACSFMAHRKNSIFNAFWLTASIHTLFNLSSYLSIVLL